MAINDGADDNDVIGGVSVAKPQLQYESSHDLRLCSIFACTLTKHQSEF